MRNKLYAVLLLTLLGTAFAAFGIEGVSLDYFEGGIYIDTPQGARVEGASLTEGYLVPSGSTVSTEGDGYAELKLSDDTIITLEGNTTFTVTKLKGTMGSSMNVFQISYGKFTAVVAKAISTESTYQFEGNASVCGVRGTKLSMWIRTNDKTGKEEESAYTIDGDVDYWKKNNPNEKIKLPGGKYANAYDSILKANDIPREMMDDFNKKLAEKRSDKVRKEREKEGTPEPTKPPEAEGTPEPEPTKESEGEGTPEATKEPEAEPTKAPDGKEPTIGTPQPEGTKETGKSEGAGLPDWLSRLLGLEIGSITIGGETYAKAVLNPAIAVDKLKMALYLPVIYKENIFDPANWYKPDGNSEWSFGSDYFGKSDFAGGAGDLVSDLFLKIKYVQWGEQRDPFFVKLGNVNNFTIGHGLLMKNYANDAEFPAVRRIGFNLGMDFTTIGFELVANDLARIASSPRIAGARLYARPGGTSFPLAIGVSTVADFNPAEGMSMLGGTITADTIGNPMFFNVALDLDFPIINTDPLRVVAFADVGGMLPYLRTEGQGAYSSLSPGLKTEAMFGDNGFANWGFMTGVLGNIAIFTYEADFRYYTGTFKPAFYDRTYDRASNDLALSTANYLSAPGDYDDTTLGIYGEGGIKLENIFSLSAGYMLPMTLDGDGFRVGEGEDLFHAKFTLEPKIIPMVNLSGSISYDRSFFVSMLLGKTSDTGKKLDFFDEYSVLSGEIIYGVAKTMDLVLLLTTAVARDASGAVIYESDGITKKIDVTWGIETRIHF